MRLIAASLAIGRVIDASGAAASLGEALSLGLGYLPPALVLAVLFGCDLCCATPIAYQINLLIMSEGGYDLCHYARAGAPLAALMVMVLSVLLVLWYGL